MKRILNTLVTALLIASHALAGNENWITSLNLNDNLYLSQFSLPGAHNAATGEGFSGTSAIGAAISGKCQSLNLGALWDAGVRVFDLRPTDDNNCPIHHGVLTTKINLTQALNTITGRLQANPREFAIILMRNENDNGSTDNWKSRVSAIINNFAERVIPFNPNLRYGDIRGKVLVLSRDYFADGYTIDGLADNAKRTETSFNGDGAFRYVVQDYYNISNASEKQDAIRALLNEARNCNSPNYIFSNNTSGYNGGTGTNSNISSNARSSNLCALNHINANPGHIGIIMMDFAGTNSDDYHGADLVNAIIAQNNRLMRLNLSTLPDDTDYFLQNVQTGLWLQGNTAKTTTSRDGWNTAANMGSYGRPFRIQNYAADGYTLNTQSGTCALGCNYGDANLLYLDNSIGPTKWKITGTRDEARISVNWDRWLSVDDNNHLVNNNRHSTWKIWTRAERIAKMSDATPANPQDVTWLIVNPELMNNDKMQPQWVEEVSAGSGKGMVDGFRPNRIFEAWNFTRLDFHQTITGLPNGRYRILAHAMYSPTGNASTNINDYNDYVSRGDATVCATLYANDSQVKLPSIYSFVNKEKKDDYTTHQLASGVNIVDGWWQIARAMGEDDRFLTEPLEVAVTDGTLRIGVHNTPGNPSSNWVAIGSFQLFYLGNAKEKFSIAISDAHYATFVAPFDATLPANVTASTATIAENGITIDLTPIAGPVPAHTPVILSANTTTVFTVEGYPTAANRAPTNGALTGTYTDITAPTGSYVLQNQSSGIGFYRVDNSGTAPRVRAHQAYLTTPSSTNVKAFLFDNSQDNITTPQPSTLIPQPSTLIYDLSGRQIVARPSGTLDPSRNGKSVNGKLPRGIYIVNGHKVIIQ